MIEINKKIPESFLREEARAILVGEDKKKLWAVLLDLLIEFDRVCKKNKLTYYLSAGTLLGAVRHQGFIPWDDDVDVVMFRADYEKLAKIGEVEFRAPYFLQTPQNEGFSVGRTFARLRRSDTTAILSYEMVNGRCSYRYNQGIFIDIFILDGLPEDPSRRASFFSQAMKLKRSVGRARLGLQHAFDFRFAMRGPRNFSLFCYGLCLALIKFISGVNFLEKLAIRYNRFAKRFDRIGVTDVAIITYDPNYSHQHQQKAEWYGDPVELSFEEFVFPCPCQYEQVLDATYGNWREHVVGCSCHDVAILDVSRSYIDYLK